MGDNNDRWSNNGSSFSFMEIVAICIEMKKIEPYILLLGFILCCSISSPRLIDMELLSRHIAFAAITIVLFVLIIRRSMRETIDFSILKRWIFPVFAGYLLVSAITLIWAINKAECLNEILKIVVLFFYLFCAVVIDKKIIIKYLPVIAIVLCCVGLYEFYIIKPDRLVGTMSNKNLWSSGLFMLLPLCVYSAFAYKNIWRTIGIVGSILILINISLMMCRSVWLAVIITGCFVMTKKPKLLLILVAAIVIILDISYLLKDNPRVISLKDRITCRMSLSERGLLWGQTLKMVRDNPLGVGAGNWKIKAPIYDYGDDFIGNRAFNEIYYQRTHNDFLCVLAEIGFVGSAFYLGIFGFVFYYLFKNFNGLALMVFSGVVGCMIVSFFSYSKERTFLPMMLMFYFALAISNYHKPVPLEISKARIYSYSNVALASLVFALTVFCIRYKAEASVGKIYMAKLNKDWKAVVNEIENYSPLYSVCPLAKPVKMYYGQANEILGQKEQALYYYNEALKANPNHVDVWTKIGTLHSSLGRYEEGIKAYHKAINICPGFSVALANLGFSYGRMGDNYRGIKYIKRAIEVKPDYKAAKNNLRILRTIETQNLLAFINKYGWGS